MKRCECIEEPRGRKGLEGYSRGLKYRFEKRKEDKNGKPYIRVYPLEDYYYETCSINSFKRFFKEI